jgi:hypothetical protein
MLRTIGITFLSSVLLALPVGAQSPTIESCASLTGEKEGDGLASVKCVAALAKSIKGLQSHALPSDAIVLSATRCEDFGWRKLDEALGRTVIGAGAVGTVPPGDDYVYYKRLDGNGKEVREKLRPYKGEPYKPLEPGGAEEVVLTEAHMPAHNHLQSGYLFWLYKQRNGDHGIQTTWNNGKPIPDAYGQVGNSETLTRQGGSQPHPNMPPYIALYFCKKD